MSLLWPLLRETIIMLLEIYALLWKALRETVLLLRYPIMAKKPYYVRQFYYYQEFSSPPFPSLHRTH